MKNDIEIRSMELLCDMQGEACPCAELLGRKGQQGASGELLRWYSARYINRAAEGYTVLRKASMTDASKLLIRPAIEAMIRAMAVQKQPDFLYRIAYTERKDHGRMARPIVAKAGRDYDAEDERLERL